MHINSLFRQLYLQASETYPHPVETSLVVYCLERYLRPCIEESIVRLLAIALVRDVSHQGIVLLRSICCSSTPLLLPWSGWLRRCIRYTADFTVGWKGKMLLRVQISEWITTIECSTGKGRQVPWLVKAASSDLI